MDPPAAESAPEVPDASVHSNHEGNSSHNAESGAAYAEEDVPLPAPVSPLLEPNADEPEPPLIRPEFLAYAQYDSNDALEVVKRWDLLEACDTWRP